MRLAAPLQVSHAQRIARFCGVALGGLVAVAALMPGAAAQTLLQPYQQAPPSAQPASKPVPARRVKSCSAYGAGFVALPGSDACVKVGGWVGSEATEKGR